MIGRRADVQRIIDWARERGAPVPPLVLEMRIALEELLYLRGQCDSDLQMRVMRARVGELLEAKPKKAEEMRGCWDDLAAVLARRGVELLATTELVLEALRLLRDAGLGEEAFELERRLELIHGEGRA